MIVEPPPLHGINRWCLSSARRCQLAGVSAEEAVSRILAFSGSARRPIKPSEARRAVEKAYSTKFTSFRDLRPKEEWQPERSDAVVARNQVSVDDLRTLSPIPCDHTASQLDYLALLFPRTNGLLCVGWSTYRFSTDPLPAHSELENAQFIVPAYMIAKTGRTQEGKLSEHCLNNTGPRIYCVCDFDEPSSAQHAGIIWELKQLYRLVMVVSSGGKSLHGWFHVPKDRQPAFWRVAIRLGADPAIERNRSSFVRIPMGRRDNGNRQVVHYFDPLSYRDFGRRLLVVRRDSPNFPTPV